ncbi:hypothetical protein ACE2NF_003362 [Salmonella enterica]|nr:hypothetical protein [Salmonella enterica]
MSLLREIQQAAIDPSIDLPSLLRKCKVLASRLGNQEFKQWINFELNGYPDQSNLPDYRVFDVEVRGYFTGSFHRVLNNANVPPSCILKELREALFTCRMNTPVAALVSLTKNSDGIAQEPWNADVTAYVGRQIIQDMNCLRAWKVIPVNLLASILDVIRTKILDFALEIEAENPEAGEAQPNTQPIPQEKVQQVFNTYIVGNGNNIATASQHVSQETNNTDTHAEVFSQLLDAFCARLAMNQLRRQLQPQLKKCGRLKTNRASWHTIPSLLHCWLTTSRSLDLWLRRSCPCWRKCYLNLTSPKHYSKVQQSLKNLALLSLMSNYLASRHNCYQNQMA